jgi:HAD superfamily hydrolase (TIGR01490 family)
VSVGRAAAVFDLDGTLLRGTSAERLLLPWLLRRGVIGASQLMCAFRRLASLPLRGSAVALRGNKRWLAGVRVERVLENVPLFVQEVLAPRICPLVLAELRNHRAGGATIWLLTGAPAFVGRAVAEWLGMEGVVATEVEVSAGRFTGEIAGRHVYAEAKCEALAQLAEARGIDLRASYGFADHGSDVPFLECFGRAVAVRPGRRLRREARRRGWTILR